MKENYQIFLPYQFRLSAHLLDQEPEFSHKKTKTMFLWNLSKRRRLTNADRWAGAHNPTRPLPSTHEQIEPIIRCCKIIEPHLFRVFLAPWDHRLQLFVHTQCWTTFFKFMVMPLWHDVLSPWLTRILHKFCFSSLMNWCWKQFRMSSRIQPEFLICTISKFSIFLAMQWNKAVYTPPPVAESWAGAE